MQVSKFHVYVIELLILLETIVIYIKIVVLNQIVKA